MPISRQEERKGPELSRRRLTLAHEQGVIKGLATFASHRAHHRLAPQNHNRIVDHK